MLVDNSITSNALIQIPLILRIESAKMLILRRRNDDLKFVKPQTSITKSEGSLLTCSIDKIAASQFLRLECSQLMSSMLLNLSLPHRHLNTH